MNAVYEDKKLLDVLGTNRRITYTKSKFTPMRNSQYLNIFSDQIHASIWAVLNIDREPYATERAFGDIKLNYIHRSLNEQVRNRINKLKDYEGTPLKRKILSRIYRHLISGRLDELDLSDLEGLGSDHEWYKRSRSVSKENELISLINRKAKPLNYEMYGGYTKERMRLWKTLAPDLEKAIPYIDSDSVLNFIDVNMDDSYTLLDYNGDSQVKYINEGDFITYINTEGDSNYLDLDSLLSNAVMLDFDDTRAAFAMLNEDYGTTLTAVSDEEALVEETYSLEDPRENFYFLKLDPSTVEDLPRTNPLIRKSSATFTLVTDDDEINEWIEYKPWPYLHFYIEASDPLIDHMLNSGKVLAEFKDVSFDKLQGYADETPVLPRRIPWYITIIPTDRTRYLVGSGRSSLTGYNSRKAVFRLSPSKKDVQQRWDSDIYNEEISDFFEGVDPRVEQKTVKVKFNKNKLPIKKRLYKDSTEKLPRKPSSARRLFEAIRAAKDDENNFIDASKETIEWAAVLKNMTPYERRDIYNDIEKFSQKKDLIATNKFATKQVVKDRFVKITDVIDRNLTNVNDYEPPPVKQRSRPIKIDDDFEEETPEVLE